MTTANEAADRIRNRLRMRADDPCDEGCHEDDQYIVSDGLEEALAAERRLTVDRIRVAVGVMRTPAGRDIGYIQIGEQQFRAVLNEIADGAVTSSKNPSSSEHGSAA